MPSGAKLWKRFSAWFRDSDPGAILRPKHARHDRPFLATVESYLAYSEAQARPARLRNADNPRRPHKPAHLELHLLKPSGNLEQDAIRMITRLVGRPPNGGATPDHPRRAEEIAGAGTRLPR